MQTIIIVILHTFYYNNCRSEHSLPFYHIDRYTITVLK